MNKKLAMIGAGVVAGSVLLMSSVYAGIGDAQGYDTLKSAIKNTATVDNVTRKVNLSVEDNGKVLFQVNSTLKTSKTGAMGSAEFTLKSGETEQNIHIFNQDNQKIIKTSQSDVYRIVDMDIEEDSGFKKFRDHKDLKQHDPAFAQEVENVIDTLVGNLKNYVTLKEEGASKEVALHLTGSQIPALVNTAGSLLIREGGREHGDELELNPANTFGVNVQSIKDSLPKLAEDIKIQTVSMDADVNADNLIASHTAEIQISGKDSEGIQHQVVVKLTVDSSDFNNTIPDTVDLTGKQVENVKPFNKEAMTRWHK